MPSRNAKRLDEVEKTFVARGIQQALALARRQERQDFARMLIDNLPRDGRGHVWIDWDLLTDTELELLAQEGGEGGSDSDETPTR